MSLDKSSPQILVAYETTDEKFDQEEQEPERKHTEPDEANCVSD